MLSLYIFNVNFSFDLFSRMFRRARGAAEIDAKKRAISTKKLRITELGLKLINIFMDKSKNNY